MNHLTKQENNGNGLVEKEKQNTIVLTPPVNILDGEKDTILILEMPGVEDSGLDITLEKDVLEIIGKPMAPLTEGFESLHKEFYHGEYRRKFNINRTIDFDKITAVLKHGRLKITLPKVQPDVKKIEIKTN